MAAIRKHCSYDAAFKLRAVDFAKEKGNQAAGHEFGISEKVV